MLAPSFVRTRTRPDSEALREAARILGEARAPAIVAGDGAAASGAGAAVAAVAGMLGATVYSTATEAVVERSIPLPLFDMQGVATLLAQHDAVLAVGTAFLRLSTPSTRQVVPAGVPVVHIGSDPWELAKNSAALAILADERTALLELAAELESTGAAAREGAGGQSPLVAAADRSGADVEGGQSLGVFDADAALAALAEALPEDAIVVDESVSAIPALERRIPLRPGGWFRSRGGALGAGMAMPLGAALAAPDRPIVAIVGDGSAMYTAPALWSYAQRRLRVTAVILDNGGYGILDRSGEAAGLEPVGTRLSEPRIDFCALAVSLGVSARRVESTAGAVTAFREALAETPSLVHVVLDRTEAPQ